MRDPAMTKQMLVSANERYGCPRRLGVFILWAGFIFGCSPPNLDLEEGSWIHIVPTEHDRWSLRASTSSKLRLDGVPMASVPQQISGRRTHRLELSDLTVRLPTRQTDPCAALTFAILGDGRAHVHHIGPSAYWPGILREISTHKPAFILNTGDLVNRGTRQHEWHRYLAQTPSWPPMIAIRGNHDRGEIFAQVQAVKEPVHWFRWGPVLIVGISTEGTDESIHTIKTELNEVLEKHTAPWRIVFMHRPIWSRGRHGSDERGWNQHLVPILDRHKIHLVLAGHDHNYERFCPSRGVFKDRKCVPANQGTTYVVTGGAATFTNPIPGLSRRVTEAQAEIDANASRVFSGANHYLIIQVTAVSLSVSVHRSRVGNASPKGLLDSFELKGSSQRCPQEIP